MSLSQLPGSVVLLFSALALRFSIEHHLVSRFCSGRPNLFQSGRVSEVEPNFNTKFIFKSEIKNRMTIQTEGAMPHLWKEKNHGILTVLNRGCLHASHNKAFNKISLEEAPASPTNSPDSGQVKNKQTKTDSCIVSF